jgi:hypothetical protein
MFGLPSWKDVAINVTTAVFCLIGGYFAGASSTSAHFKAVEQAKVADAVKQAASQTASIQKGADENAQNSAKAQTIVTDAYRAAIVAGNDRLRVSCPSARVLPKPAATRPAVAASAPASVADVGDGRGTVDLDEVAQRVLALGNELNEANANLRSCQGDLRNYLRLNALQASAPE